MRQKYFQDYCVFAKDQGFLSVVGDVEQGEVLFGFSATLTGATKAIVFAVDSSNKGAGGPQVREMAGVDYQVFPFCSNESTSTLPDPSVMAYVTNKGKLGFTLHGEAGYTYDIIVKGKVRK